MYTQVWMKFMPAIRIILKRAVSSPQLIALNRTDFDKAGGGKKAGFNFTVELKNARSQTTITSAIARDLVSALQADSAAMSTLADKEFELELNSKCELRIKHTSPVEEVLTTDND